MIRGLYTSGWSLMANSKKMDVISNNLANADTNGYKEDITVFETFPEMLTRRINDTKSASNPSAKVGNMRLGSDVGEIFTNYEQGKMIRTQNNLDFAIQNSKSAFFTVGKPGEDGNITEYYSRDGAFILDANNQLVTKDGFYVMGENGPITLRDDNFTVNNDGSIVQDGIIVDKLKISEFSDTRSLRKIGSNLVEKDEATEEQPFQGIISQGFLEGSNINVVKEMVDMISVMRSYEANQRLLQAQDSTLEKVVNQVGSVR
ncbi:MAG TPA: flagellar hook-basal body protein [Pseudobacteroides sp.]|uniref:flagellar hook-basal body protein n=1 Tax=Pseudobacteroides sp. TaxID=1968840 RepID=UPI002F933297